MSRVLRSMPGITFAWRGLQVEDSLPVTIQSWVQVDSGLLL